MLFNHNSELVVEFGGWEDHREKEELNAHGMGVTSNQMNQTNGKNTRCRMQEVKYAMRSELRGEKAELDEVRERLLALGDLIDTVILFY